MSKQRMLWLGEGKQELGGTGLDTDSSKKVSFTTWSGKIVRLFPAVN